MMSLYVTLGIFLLVAARNPSANRSLIAFTAWSSLAHAAVMGFQAFRNLIARGELIGVAVLIVIGVALIVLAPVKQSVKHRHPPPVPKARRNSGLSHWLPYLSRFSAGGRTPHNGLCPSAVRFAPC